MSDGILEWEATHQMKNYPLNLRVIGIMKLKEVIHPLMNHVHATFLLVGIYGYTCPLMLLAGHSSAGVSGACLSGPDIIIGSNGTELDRVNRTLCVGSGQNIGIRGDQQFSLGLILVLHIGLGVQFSTNKCDEVRLGLFIIHILEYNITLGNYKAIRTAFIHNVIPEKFCGGEIGTSKIGNGRSVHVWGRWQGCVKVWGRWWGSVWHRRLGQWILGRIRKSIMSSISNLI